MVGFGRENRSGDVCEDDHTSKHTQIESENSRRRFQFRVRGRGSRTPPTIGEPYVCTRLKKEKKNDARRGAQNRRRRRREQCTRQ